MKPLRDTYIFNMMNKDEYIDKKMKLFTDPNTSIIATEKHLEEPILHINKTFKYPAKMAVLEAYKNGTLMPVVLKKGVADRMPVCIPFIINSDRTKAIVFIDNYATVNSSGDINIDYKKLYCLLETAYLALEGLPYNNSSVINKGSLIWAHLFTKILNKKFALNTDRTAMDRVIFLASKYFLHNIIGMTDQNTVFNYAMKNCNTATEILLRDVDAEFTPEVFENISTFISKFSNTSFKFVSGFEKITVRDYISSYAEMYGQSTILALETLEYFTFMISSVVIGAYLNNQTTLEDIIDVDGAKLYFELGR
jgi:hypothetical protein